MNDFISWSPGVTLETIEKMVILKAFDFFKKSKTATAASLAISVRTLDSKLEKYEMEAKQDQERQAHELRQRTEFLARQRGNPPNNLGIPYSPAAGHLPIASAGIRVESIANAAQEPAVSVPERKEVQGVLPKHPSPGHKGKVR